MAEISAVSHHGSASPFINDWSCSPTNVNGVSHVANASGRVFVSALQAVMAAHCALVTDTQWPKDYTKELYSQPVLTFDFVIVGAGSAGAVLANRLSENPNWNVLLIEAGGDPTFDSEVPPHYLGVMHSEIDWGYRTQPKTGCLANINQRCYWPRGKVLGGTSTINAMYYVRGNRKDYDDWAEGGCKGWSYDDVLPYFKKSENLNDDTLPQADKEKYHGVGGYLNIEKHQPGNPYSPIFIAAAQDTGLKYLNDNTGAEQVGVAKAYSTIKHGRRQSTARAFLTPIKDRKNLKVLKNTQAIKVMLDNDAKDLAIGVEILHNDKPNYVFAKKEVILSAGAIDTPKILMLSGIGPKAHLEEKGIEVVQDLPVGQYLQDHLQCHAFFAQKVANTTEFKYDQYGLSLTEFIVNQTGTLARVGEVLTFKNLADKTATYPDIQHHHAGYAANRINSTYNFFKVLEFNDEVVNGFIEINKNNVLYQVTLVLLTPESFGEVLLASDDAKDAPLINANYFKDPKDLEKIIDAYVDAVKYEDTPTFKKLGITFLKTPFNDCDKFEFKSRDYYGCLAPRLVNSLWHPVSTTRMGTDRMTSVVDPTLKVHGFKNLRVIDAGVMHKITRGNTNAPTIMIGEKGADLVKASWK